MPANFIPQLLHQTLTSMTHEGKTFSIADITPDLAEKMLSYNTQNRSKSDGSVYSYLADMQKDEWRFTGDPIRFHKNGKLLDGQHRLTAISRLNAGEAVRALVVTGLDDEDQMVMDQGRKRTAGDQLGIKGVDSSHLVASAIKWIILYEAGRSSPPTSRPRTSSGGWKTTPMRSASSPRLPRTARSHPSPRAFSLRSHASPLISTESWPPSSFRRFAPAWGRRQAPRSWRCGTARSTTGSTSDATQTATLSASSPRHGTRG